MPFPILAGISAVAELGKLGGALMDALKPPAPPPEDEADDIA